jgi:hypothetical protein
LKIFRAINVKINEIENISSNKRYSKNGETKQMLAPFNAADRALIRLFSRPVRGGRR